MRDQQIIDRLQDLPPELPEPSDRFEQVGERVARRRRQRTAIGAGAAVAVAALAVPLTAQLLPESADIVPGGGGQTSQVVEPTLPALPDWASGTVLSEPRSVTGTGTATVELGERPQGATGVAMVLVCLSPGVFTYPDGALRTCGAGGEAPTSDPSHVDTSYVVDLPEGADQIEFGAPDGARWQLTTAYVGTEPESGGEVLPGFTEVTALGETVTHTGTGTETVDLGPRPAGATAVSIQLDCLTPGTFAYPDGAAMACDEVDPVGPTPPDGDAWVQTGYVVQLPTGAELLHIAAGDGESWLLAAAYVATEVTEWEVNARGETYGVENVNGSPDLIAVIATNGRHGYAYRADLGAAGGPMPTDPADAMVKQQERLGQTFSVPVYESDGETLIGEFVIGGDLDPDDAIVTWQP